MSPLLQRESFRAMGTVCTLAVSARPTEAREAARALAAARDEVERCERVLSRFDAASDLSRLNREAGRWVEADVRLLDALTAALDAREATGGRFDPTVLPALVAAGYDRTFEQLRPRPPRSPAGRPAGAAVELDRRSSRARVEAGAGVDLGGIGKGFSAGRALDALWAAWPGARGGLADLGGDVELRGSPPDGDRWRVDVADPRAPGRRLATLELGDAGVATSGRDRRRFGPGLTLHHLIDPATGRPAVAGPLAVTVVARTAAESEAHATALAIAAVEEAQASLAAAPHLSALYVPAEGDPLVLGPMPLLGPRTPARQAAA